MEQINILGIGEIKVRRSMNIKFLSIRMAPGRGIWINVPYGVSGKQVLNFIEEKRAWITQTQSGMKTYEKDTGVAMNVGSEIKTKMHTLQIIQTEASEPKLSQDGFRLTLALPSDVPYERMSPFIDRVLVVIYTRESKMILPKRVRELALKYGFEYGRVSFRNNVSNWGSCSGQNHISLNIRLMKLPDDLIDYVILHELCHTLEKNHSDRFWKQMERVCSNYKQLNAALRNYHTRS